ncbi:MAG: hypothetical protein JXR96_20115 [Deltaproteobacteria bacterium]|nr:hypothetical protein [Deltaproteobacteria bacterium]
MRVASGLVLVIVLLAPEALADDSISGLWKETSTPGHKSSFVVFSQDGEQVVASCYWEHEGRSIVWHGIGTRKGRRIAYRVTHTRYPQGWVRLGEHRLTLSEDGKTMTGRWTNSRQESGLLVFVRKK